MRLAKEDADQFDIRSITAWRGDPDKPTTMEFEILFEGQLEFGSRWRVWDRDLAGALPFEDYCRSINELSPLLAPTREDYLKACVQINKLPITIVTPGEQVYLNLRWFGTAEYDSDLVTLPDKWHIQYVVLLQYTRYTSKARKHIDGFIPVLHTTVSFTHTKVEVWGKRKAIGKAVLVTEEFVRNHKSVLEMVGDSKNRKFLENKYK